MKATLKYIGIFVIAVFSTLAMAQEGQADPAAPVFFVEEEVVNFGNIQMGVPVTAEFVFRNDGKTPLVLKDVRKSCGCTSVSFPREAILPGKTGVIKAEYDASEEGSFNKKLTVLANTKEGMHYLTIKGSVLK